MIYSNEKGLDFELYLASSYVLECALFRLFLKSQIPYSSWGFGVHMKLLGANYFDDTPKPTI